jgi:hypothetical protein
MVMKKSATKKLVGYFQGIAGTGVRGRIVKQFFE